jgi:Heavy metal associated domain 2
MHQRQRAYVAHRSTGRLRIKIPAQRHNARFFSNLRRQLIEHAEIVQIEVNPLTASVLILHRAGFDPSDLQNPFLGLDIAGVGARSATRRGAAQHVANLDGSLRKLSGGDIDLASVILKLALAVVTRQTALQLVEWIAEAVLRAVIQSVTGPARPAPDTVESQPRPVLLAAA